MLTSDALTVPITIAAFVAFFEAAIFAAAPLFVIFVPFPIISPASAPKDVTSPAIFTSALTRQLSRTLLPATVLNITPVLAPVALNTAPLTRLTETLLTSALRALPSIAAERSALEIKLTFETVPLTSEKTGADAVILWPFPSRLPLKENAEAFTEISLPSST